MFFSFLPVIRMEWQYVLTLNTTLEKQKSTYIFSLQIYQNYPFLRVFSVAYRVKDPALL